MFSHMVFRYYVDFFVSPWQFDELGQCSQPQPQEDLPFFLSFIIFATIETTMASNIRPVMKVPIINHALTALLPTVFSVAGLKSI